MSRVFPRAEDLIQEEIDFELQLRNQTEEVLRLDLTAKQRHLRNLFKNDQKEGCSYKSPFNIGDEIAHIEGRMLNLEKALGKCVEPKYESRVLHYWNRAKSSQANGEDEKKMKRDLVQRIEKVMGHFQFGPPPSPVISQINNIIQGNLEIASGGQSQLSRVSPAQSERESVGAQSAGEYRERPELNVGFDNLFVGGQGVNPTGAIPKVPLPKMSSLQGGPRPTEEPQYSPDAPNTHIMVPRAEWEEMRKMMGELCTRISRDQSQRNEPQMPERNTDQREQRGNQRGSFIPATRPNYQNRIFDFHRRERDSEDEDNRIRIVHAPWSFRNRDSRTEEADSDYSEGDNRNCFRNQRDHRLTFSRHRDQSNRRLGGHVMVEKWKLRFTGDAKTAMTVENFLYKTKKLAEREEVSKHNLLRDVHMLLEGPASDWFFTFVDDFKTWEDFETSIAYRFGNPNKDQGIRTKIQERKQLRGEPFIAFVTEIEKLNRLLSKPLSNRRKFEVIWDNMRQHYRTKISIVEVKDLQQLTKLNYRIDAADPQLNMQNLEGPSAFHRRPINQINMEESDYDSDRSTSINAINSNQIRNTNQANRQTPVQHTKPRYDISNPLKCWNCQEQGHGWRQCTKPRIIFCYGCGNIGRTIRSCERCSRASDGPTTNRQGNA